MSGSPPIQHPGGVIASAAERAHHERVMLSFWLVIVVLALAGVSMMVGAAALSPAEFFAGLFGNDPALSSIVHEIRLPRTLLALLVGGILGLSGAAAQALTRNPLADPGIFGAPQAAALGAVLVLYFSRAGGLSLALPFGAIAASVVSMLLIVGLAMKRVNVTTLLLAGISIGSLCGAAISLALSLSPNPYAATEIVFWLLGSFSDRTMDHVSLVLPFLLSAATFLFLCGPTYRALALGEETARSLGVSVGWASIVTACAIAIGVGAATAVSGAIGFVGLMAPHFVRRRCGGDPMATLAPSLLMGSALMLASDIVVRLIPSTSELRVGAITALLGAPFFLYVVLAKRPGLGRVR